MGLIESYEGPCLLTEVLKGGGGVEEPVIRGPGLRRYTKESFAST